MYLRKPKSVFIDEEDIEGRTITLEFADYFLVTVYTPNSGIQLKKHKYRTQTWDPQFAKFIQELQKTKPVIIAGDLNVAHQNIDIHNPKNTKLAGFTPKERNNFTRLLEQGNLMDVYRDQHPTKSDQYTFWSYRNNARQKNKGWRLDYFLVSKSLLPQIKNTEIYTQSKGSDHAPIVLELKSK